MDGETFVPGDIVSLYLWEKHLSKNLCRFIKGVQKLEPILSLYRCRKNFSLFFLSLHQCRKTFSCFFLSLHRCRKTCFRFFLSLHRSRKTFLVFSIASLEKKILPNKIVSLYLIFFKNCLSVLLQ
jgi:hypothetical protein